LVFALGVIVVLVTGVSALHLLWWFPCSFIIGLVVLVYPLGTQLLLLFLVLLAGPRESSELPQPQARRDARGGRGKRKPRRSARAPRRTLMRSPVVKRQTLPKSGLCEFFPLCFRRSASVSGTVCRLHCHWLVPQRDCTTHFWRLC